ncbi:MAG: replication-associated recombination protein A [Syntrophomonadaceae bacterium]|nr:replication-associated recombination protein A [Syntrophomonadaceae bacterium]
MTDLFSLKQASAVDESAPLAWRMRPRTLEELYGQSHILAPGAPLRRSIDSDRLHSFVLYGPPGTGKTSIARVIAHRSKSHFEYMKAVSAGVADIRKLAADAADRQKYYQQRTILFLDEIHRFNKAQQDVLLPFVEDGALILIGATTENPLYELNNALLSRCRLYILEPLDESSIISIIKNALRDKERGLGKYQITIEDEAFPLLVRASQGDARVALNLLDTMYNSYYGDEGLTIDAAMLQRVSGKLLLKYDRSGDRHFDTISAFIKSIRGSDPDAALYWMAAMIEAGEDPKYIARRLVVHAAEDIGLADPMALVIATSAVDALNFVGLPEAAIPLAEATIYLATAPKSNSAKEAIHAALNLVRQQNKITVPPHIADASHSKAGPLLGKGKGYLYPPSFGGYVEQDYLPPELKGTKLYKPMNNGYEQAIAEFQQRLRERYAEQKNNRGGVKN